MAQDTGSHLPETGDCRKRLINMLMQWVFGPIAVWLMISFLVAIPFPLNADEPSLFNWANLALGVSLLYYLTIGPRLGALIILFWLACVWVISAYGAFWPRWQFYSAMIVIAWIGQFWRQQVEGNRAGIFINVQFLLIGPAWLISFLYKRLGIAY